MCYLPWYFASLESRRGDILGMSTPDGLIHAASEWPFKIHTAQFSQRIWRTGVVLPALSVDVCWSRRALGTSLGKRGAGLTPDPGESWSQPTKLARTPVGKSFARRARFLIHHGEVMRDVSAGRLAPRATAALASVGHCRRGRTAMSHSHGGFVSNRSRSRPTILLGWRAELHSNPPVVRDL